MKRIIFLYIVLLIFSACGSSNVSNKQKESKENLAKQKFGIEIANLSIKERETSGLSHGVIIMSIYPSFPANKAGLLKGDIIVKLDTHNILNLDQLNEVLKGYKYKYGQITLNIVREKKTQQFTLYLE